MAKVLVTESYLADIGNAIRNKNGSTESYTPGQMAEAIINIPTGGGANTEDALLTGTYAGPYSNDRVTALNSSVFANQKYITTISLPAVKSISSSSSFRPFDGSSVTELDLPELTRINNYAFAGATKLVSISAPKLTRLEYGALGPATLKNVNMPNLTYLGDYSFSGSGFTTINLPLVVEMGQRVFENCKSLRTISLPSLTTVESYDADNSSLNGYQFSGCTSLTTADMPLVERISSDMFYNCSALTSVSAPSASFISRYGFYGCTALTKIDSTMFPAITSISRSAFYGCSKLQTVEFNQYVSMSEATVFKNCTSLMTVICRSGCAIGSTTFESTPLRGNGGYVYVPRSNVNTLTYADSSLSVRALEDYTVDGTTTGTLDPNKI